MFEHRARFQSDSEYLRQRAAQQGATLAQWRREAETWFDGSVESVDRRLAMCQRLLGSAQERIARVGLAADDGDTLAFVGSLEQTKEALKELRHDLVTGSTWREDPTPPMTERQASTLMALLSSEDRRYVELTSAQIVAADDEHTDARELAARARYLAARDTSSFNEVRADRVIDALAHRVASRAEARPVVRTASRPRATPDFPAELMYF